MALFSFLNRFRRPVPPDKIEVGDLGTRDGDWRTPEDSCFKMIMKKSPAYLGLTKYSLKCGHVFESCNSLLGVPGQEIKCPFCERGDPIP